MVRRLRSFDVGVTPVIPGLVWELLRCPRPDVFHVHVAHAGTAEAVALVARLPPGAVSSPTSTSMRNPPPGWASFSAATSGDPGPGAGQRRTRPGPHGQLPAHARREVLPGSEPGPGAPLRHPHGDAERAGPPPSADDTRVRMLTVGRMAREKNFALAHRLGRRTRREGPPRRGARRGRRRTHPRRGGPRIADLGLGSRVHLAGRLDGSALVDAYDGPTCSR